MSAPLNNKILIRIIKLSEVSFSSMIPEKFNQKKASLTISINVEIKAKKNDNIEVLINSSLLNETKKGDVELVALKTSSLYEVKDLEKFLTLNEENKEITKVEDNLLFILLSNSIGSTRGMFASKLASLSIGDYVIPLIDISELIKESKL